MAGSRPSSAQIDPTIITGIDPHQDPGQTIITVTLPEASLPQDGAEPAVRRLGYAELDEIGRGGLGVVVEARQEAFDRIVALKRQQSGDRGAALRFYAEAVVSAQLEHPNIVPIHDLLSDHGGRLSLVMKRLDGRPWKSVLQPGDDPEELATAARYVLDDHLDILLKVCDAISFAHSRGIIHRDLKPENVMIGSHGEVTVMDWGCALAFGEREQHPVIPRVEEVNRISGTPGYMAPEMVLLQPNRLGPCSDVYLLGGILYSILTGTRPHRGADLHAVVRAAAIGAIEPPQLRAPERTIPPELAKIALAALDPDPDRRTPGVQAFADAIRSYRRHAQALALAAMARSRIAEASASHTPTVIDDRLRRAVAAAENAVDLWPDWQPGRALLASACLAWARHCLSTGGHTQAQGLATQATLAARSAGDDATMRGAMELTQHVRAAIARSRAHARTLRLARLGGLAAGLLAIVAVSIGFVAVSNEQARTATALAESEHARIEATLAQKARAADQLAAAPGMLAQARFALQDDHLDEAARSLALAVTFDARLAEAQALAALVAIAQDRWDAAAARSQAWIAVAPVDAQAITLAGICRRRPAAPATMHVDDRTALAEIAGRLGAYRLAGRWVVDATARLAFHRAQLARTWPELADSLVLDELCVRFTGGKPSFAGRRDLTDLTPLTGMPFSELDLGRTGITSLAPLHGMPLRSLTIVETAVSDLAPLAGSPLRNLVAYSCPKLTSLAPLAGCLQLRSLTLANIRSITDITPLSGLPLESLDLGSNPITSLAPLRTLSHLRILVVPKAATFLPADIAGLPLERLSIYEHPEFDLATLRGRPLTGLGLSGCAVSDLSWITGMPLTDLDLQGARVSDLSPLRGLRLRSLILAGVPVTDLSPLAGMPLEDLNIAGTQATSLEPLAGMPVKWLRLGNRCQLGLGVLASMPLQSLSVGSTAGLSIPDVGILRNHATLKTIIGNWEDGELPRDEWVRRYEAHTLH